MSRDGARVSTVHMIGSSPRTQPSREFHAAPASTRVAVHASASRDGGGDVWRYKKPRPAGFLSFSERDGAAAARRRWRRGGGGHRAAPRRPPRARPLPPPHLPRPLHGGGSEPEVAPGGGAVAGVTAAAELRGAAHRRRHRRAPRPRRRQPPRPRHVSSTALADASTSLHRSSNPFLTLPPRSWSSRSCWGCQITDEGLIKISSADCVGNLTSISLWGLAGITDKGVVQLVSRAYSLQHLNIGGTFITDESLNAVANSCTNLKSIILWSCRHVTEAGLVELVNKCRRLECINVGGMRVPPESFVGLLSISPALRIRSIPQILNAGVQVS